MNGGPKEAAADEVARSVSTTNPLRVVIIGAGQMAHHHVQALARINIPNEIVGVVDPDRINREELLASLPSAEGFDLLDGALLETNADVVHICTPPHTHVELARVAVEAACHIYVEKPFAAREDEARTILSLARERSLRVCAGHQLLWERPSKELLTRWNGLGRVCHVESFFAFRPSRRGLASHEQLKDVLPHPLYLLIYFLEMADSDSRPEVDAIRVGADGTLHCLIGAGDVTGTLVLTITGRPVANFVKVVGSNGMLKADYVRGIVLQAIGPGSSTVDKVLEPFRTSRQLAFRTIGSLGRRVLRAERSYPGLRELFEDFYGSVVERTSPPLSDEHLIDTVRLYERISQKIDGPPREVRDGTPAGEVAWNPADFGENGSQGVVVTGGTGFLGSEVVRQLAALDVPVRVLSRRIPAHWERVDGADYQAIDLAAECQPQLLEGFRSVIHCAAETSGSWDEHERNSIEATVALLKAAAHAGLTQVLHVSTIAALERPADGGAIGEDSHLKLNDRSSGPYVWGKLNAEKAARELGDELGIPVKVARPGAIVDYKNFEPPGRLGRRIGNLFIAVGPRSERIGVVDRTFAARTLVWLIRNFEDAPDALNLLDPELPTREALVDVLRLHNPGIRVFWFPRLALKALSACAVVLQKFARPDREPLRVDQAFLSDPYDNASIQRLQRRMNQDTSPPSREPTGQM